MSHDVVPALVLFSIVLGVALIGVSGKEGLLRSLRVLDEALMAITGFVAKTTPEKPAVVSARTREVLPYAELDARSDRLAQLLWADHPGRPRRRPDADLPVRVPALRGRGLRRLAPPALRRGRC